MSLTSLAKVARPETASPDRIVVIGGSERTLDVLRIAAIRSDDVVLFVDRLETRIKRFTDMFAIAVEQRRAGVADLVDTAAVLVTTGEPESENWAVRNARRHNIPVHVAERPLVSDFTLIELVERHSCTFAAQPG